MPTNPKPCEFKILRVRECPPPGPACDTPEQAYRYWRENLPPADWYDPAKEAFVVLVLNRRHRILGHNLVALGGVAGVGVRPLEVFRPVLVAAGSALVLMHNHPSGDPAPSDADRQVTRDLCRAAALLRLDVLDHVIVGDHAWASLRELGLM